MNKAFGFFLSGRSGGIWTHGLLVPNQARYHLRYTYSKKSKKNKGFLLFAYSYNSNSINTEKLFVDLSVDLILLYRKS